MVNNKQKIIFVNINIYDPKIYNLNIVTKYQ